jgi:alpha,alpha-trehalase
MILAVFQTTRDRDWLRSTMPAIDRSCAFWSREPHLVPATGLSRYHTTWGKGLPPRSPPSGTRWAAPTTTACAFFRTHQVADHDLTRFYDRRTDTLTDRFHVAD